MTSFWSDLVRAEFRLKKRKNYECKDPRPDKLATFGLFSIQTSSIRIYVRLRLLALIQMKKLRQADI